MSHTGKRSYLVGPWHYCARCGTRYHISQMEWQDGLLLCKDTPENCFDTSPVGLPLVGDRNLAVAAALRNAYDVGNKELLPDDKLTNSEEIQASFDEQDLIY